MQYTFRAFWTLEMSYKPITLTRLQREHYTITPNVNFLIIHPNLKLREFQSAKPLHSQVGFLYHSIRFLG